MFSFALKLKLTIAIIERKEKAEKNCKTYVLLLSIHCVVNSKRSRKDISNCTAEEILSAEFWSFIIGTTKNV